MLTIYHVPRTRSERPLWLCYELGLDVEVQRIDFSQTYRDTAEWREISPAGKVPALKDGDLTLFESGAMVEYILDQYGEGRLRPAQGTPERALYNQWCWFSEATLSRPLGLFRILRAGEGTLDDLVEDGRKKFHAALGAVELALTGKRYLLGETFMACDIMMAYTLILTQKLLDDRYPNIRNYVTQLETHEAYQRLAEQRD